MSTAETAPIPFEARQIGERTGAEIVGLDLREPFDDATRSAVHDAFLRHQVLAFRDQDLDVDEQVAFTEQFGTLERHVLGNRSAVHPLLHVVTNLDEEGRPSGQLQATGWHSDKSIRPEPSMATILHAKRLPPAGGDTCFADMYGAYDALDDEGKAEVDGLAVVHSWALGRARLGVIVSEAEKRDAPDMAHPLARIHPDTGRRCLFMGDHAHHIDGWPIPEGQALIDRLHAHATEERFVYRHEWRPGDVLMWDNRCLLHRVDTNFDAGRHARVLHRTCLRGTAPA